MKVWKCRVCGFVSAEDAKACASCLKRKPRAKASLPERVEVAHECVLLALDAGECTGWSIWVRDVLVASGQIANIFSDQGVGAILGIVARLKRIALGADLPIIVIHEATWGGHMGLAMPATVGYWLFPLRNAEVPLRAIGHVYPARWRSVMLPKGMHAAKRDVVRSSELAHAAIIVGRPCGDDEAPAVLIGAWARRSGEVGEMLPKKKG